MSHGSDCDCVGMRGRRCCGRLFAVSRKGSCSLLSISSEVGYSKAIPRMVAAFRRFKAGKEVRQLIAKSGLKKHLATADMETW